MVQSKPRRPLGRHGKEASGARPSPASGGIWRVRYHPGALGEVNVLPSHERNAIDNAVDKLGSLGPLLAFPHSSKVMGDPGGALRELRPRAGRSPWRCIYERIGDVFVIAAIAPEAQKDKAGFDRSVRDAKARLAEVEA